MSRIEISNLKTANNNPLAASFLEELHTTDAANIIGGSKGKYYGGKDKHDRYDDDNGHGRGKGGYGGGYGGKGGYGGYGGHDD
jgi:hypothetical protein